MTLDELIKEAEAMGFSHVGTLNVEALEPIPEVRDMCAENKCGRYGHSWSCPPACGTIEELGAKMHTYSRGIIVQTTAEMEDSFDYEAMMEGSKTHGEHFREFHDRLCEIGGDFMFLAAGSCGICKQCTYPDAPCRFPERMMTSMEASGLLVNQVCKDSGIPYYYGKNTVTYTSAVLLR